MLLYVWVVKHQLLFMQAFAKHKFCQVQNFSLSPNICFANTCCHMVLDKSQGNNQCKGLLVIVGVENLFKEKKPKILSIVTLIKHSPMEK